MKITGWTITFLRTVFKTEDIDRYQHHLATMPPNTVGYHLHLLLEQHGYKLIPGFSNHDLKHLVLEYDMNLKDEVLMQAYLLGNGNWSWACLMFFGLVLFMPGIWKQVPKHFVQGRRSPSIVGLYMVDCVRFPLSEVREAFGRK